MTCHNIITTVSKATKTNKAIVNEATRINKAKNDANIYNDHVDNEIHHDKYTKIRKISLFRRSTH